MGLFVYFAVPLICTLMFRHFVRQPTGSLFLEGLAAFLPQTSPIPAPPPGPKATKRDRKLLQKRQLQLKGAQSSLVMQQLSPHSLNHLSSEPTTFASNFETLGILLLVLFVGLLVHFALGPLFGLWQDVLLYTLGPMVILWGAGQLVLLECSGSLVRLLGDKLRVLLLWVVAGAGAFALLTAAPQGWIRWDVEGGARQLDELFNAGMVRLFAARVRQMQPPPPLVSDPTHVAAGLAVVAGLLAAVMLAPAARVAKLYSYINPVPFWAEKYLRPTALAAGAVRLALALPLVVVLYGIPLMADFWGLPPALVKAAGPALVAAAALTQLFAVRPLAAAHLGSGLMEWHLLRHEGTGAAANSGAGGGGTNLVATREVVMRKRLTLVYATVGHVALQLLAPAAILTCLALLYGGSSGCLDSFRPPKPLLINLAGRAPVLPPVIGGPAGGVAAAAAATAGEGLEGLDGAAAPEGDAGAAAAATASAAAALPPMPPLDFVYFAAGFLAWWCCLANCMFTYPMLFVYRSGMHVGS